MAESLGRTDNSAAEIPKRAPNRFVHLHAHSEFSLAEGLLKVKGAVSEAVARQIPAMALTDRNNLFALVKFYENSLSKGLKPILGAELWITPEEEGPAARIVALAQNTQGYKNLLSLISNSYTDADRRGEVSEQQLFSREQGLIILSGGVGGHLWHSVSNGDEQTLSGNPAAVASRVWRSLLFGANSHGSTQRRVVYRVGRAGRSAVGCRCGGHQRCLFFECRRF
jgi:DNA polymerase III alpha subunit